MEAQRRRPFRLGPGDAERYARLRLRMLHAAPWAFGSSPDEDAALDAERLRGILSAGQNAILAIAADGPAAELIAAAGIVRQVQAKAAHRAALWGVYVDEAYRGGGLGRGVVQAAVDLARTWPGVDYIDLGVSENSPAAQSLYQSLGFRAWGREPESLQVGEQRFDEIFMALRL